MKAYQRLAEVMAQCSWNPKKKWERDTKDSDSLRAMCHVPEEMPQRRNEGEERHHLPSAPLPKDSYA